MYNLNLGKLIKSGGNKVIYRRESERKNNYTSQKKIGFNKKNWGRGCIRVALYVLVTEENKIRVDEGVSVGENCRSEIRRGYSKKRKFRV